MKQTHQIWIFACLSVWSSCKPEHPKATLSTIMGDWEVKSATRNGRKTELLSGTFFRFQADSNVLSNLPITAQIGNWQSPFNFQNDSVLTFGQPEIHYSLQNWTDSTLNIAFITRGVPFTLALVKTTLNLDTREKSAPAEED